MRYLKSMLLIVILLFLAAGSAFAYDTQKPDPIPLGTELEDSLSYVKIASYGLATGLIKDKEHPGAYRLKQGHFLQQGSGVVVAAGYILTAAHVIKPKTIALSEDYQDKYISDVISVDFRVVMIRSNVGAIAIASFVLYEDEASDIAILKYNHKNNSWLVPVPHPIEYGVEELKTGDILCAVLHTRDEDFRLQDDIRLVWGSIVQPGPYYPDASVMVWLKPWDITVDLNIKSGDSGSPVFVFRQGKPILIGFVRAYAMGYFVKYSYVGLLPVVTKILKGKR